MKLDFIDITNLKLSPLNVRKHGAKDGADLVPSIRSLGVLQPLLVRKNCEGYEVVAGQRRFGACQILAEEAEGEGKAFDPVPCAILADSEDALAIEASLAENIARLPMDEIDQYEAFAALTKQGQAAEDIAAHFGVTQRLVKQRLAIANLHAPILKAYRREELDGTTMRILTMATKSQQKAWFKLFKSEEDYAPEGYRLKSWLFGGDQILTSAALFDLEDYKGTIISDLFGEDAYFADSAVFWEAQSQAIARLIEDYHEDGWSEVILLDVGERFASWEYVDTAKEDGGKVYIDVAQNGEVTPYEGQLSRAEIKKREKAARIESGEQPTNTRPEITKPMQTYLSLHRHAAVRAQLLNNQGFALRLAVAQIIAGSDLWDIKADPQKANSNAIKASLAGNSAEDLFAQERLTVRALLNLPEDGHTVVPTRNNWQAKHDATAIFAGLLDLDDQAVTRILTFLVAETLSAGSAMVEMLGALMSVDMANHWTPDETFFDLMRDKEAINAMIAEIAGQSAAKGNLSETAKAQKEVIRKCLSGERKPVTENWQPRYMAFPMQGYTERGGIEAIDQWAEVKDRLKAA